MGNVLVLHQMLDDSKNKDQMGSKGVILPLVVVVGYLDLAIFEPNSSIFEFC